MGTDGIRVKQQNGQQDAQRHPAARVSNGKKFSVTVQVPEEVAARWPEWFTTDKLMDEAYKAAAVAGAPARARARSRLGIFVVGLLLVELFVAGIVLGYVAAGRFRLVAVNEPPAVAVGDPAAAAAADPVSSDSASASASGPAPAATDAPEPDESATASAPDSMTKQANTGALRALAVNPARTYRVQLGAFRVQNNADDLVFRLRRDGYQPTVRTSRGFLFVQIGSFKTRSAAQRLADDLRAKRYDALVVP